mgnify:CR=1 FL=1
MSIAKEASKYNKWIFLSLVFAFLSYSYIIYVKGAKTNEIYVLSDQAKQGKKLWQENNCTACHQVYGLGGYLGPDLTNVYSRYKEGLAGFLIAGKGAMPAYEFNKEQQTALVEYFKYIDRSGYYPNKEVETTWYGDVLLKDDKNAE